jgi:hypothetical protein
LWWALSHYGILGAALAWTIRAWFDALALYAMSLVLIPECRSSAMRLGLSVIAAVTLFFVAMQFQGLLEKCLFTLSVLAGFSCLVWCYALEKKERSWIMKGLGVGGDR